MKNCKKLLDFYLSENDLKILKTEIPDKWKFLPIKLDYPYEYFNSIDDFQKLVNKLKKGDFFSKLKKDYPSEEEIEKTKQSFKLFNIKNGEELTQLYLKVMFHYLHECMKFL